MNFDILDALLEKRHISRRALAIAVGINENKMSSAFKRRSGLSSEDVLKIARYLGVNPYMLEGWSDEELYVLGLDSPDAGEKIFKMKIDDDQRQRLDAAFDKLNSTGQQEAVKRVEELTEIPRYQADNMGGQ